MKTGWQEKTLDDVCDLITCGVAAKPDYVDKGIPFLSAKNVKDGKIILSGYNCVSKETHDELTKNNKPLKGDILYTRVGSYGEAAVIEDEAEFSVFVSLTLIKPKKDLINNYYLKYYLNSSEVKELAKRSISSSGVGNLNVGTVRKFPIQFPDRIEQQRIVSILNEAFAGIATATANAEKNLANSRELFESYLQSVFVNKGEGWVGKSLGEVIEIRNGRNQQAVLCENGQYKIMGSAGNVMGYASDYICEAGTTIIGRKGNISKPIYINERFWNVDTAFGFYPKDNIDKKFVYYLCLTIDFAKMNRGTTIPSLVKSELQTIQISFPKLLETQQSIVQKLDELSTETKRLEAIYQQKLIALEELKKSILNQAFSGQLQ